MSTKNRCSLLFATAVFVLGPSVGFSVDPCEKAVLPTDFFSVEEANGVIRFSLDGGRNSSRARVYPLDYVLRNLGLTEAYIRNFTGRVLLAGEGYGKLLPEFLQSPRAVVTAVDPIYALNPIPPGFMGEGLRDYVQRFAQYLNPASADRLPFETRSVDLYIAHFLVNNFGNTTVMNVPGVGQQEFFEFLPIVTNMVTESIRVLRPGGRAIFAGFVLSEDFENLMEDVEERYAGRPLDYRIVEIATFDRVTDYATFGSLAPDFRHLRNEEETISRLVIERIR